MKTTVEMQRKEIMKIPKSGFQLEAATGGFLQKKMFSKISQKLRNICNFIKKETPTQVFFCELCEILQNTSCLLLLSGDRNACKSGIHFKVVRHGHQIVNSSKSENVFAAPNFLDDSSLLLHTFVTYILWELLILSKN